MWRACSERSRSSANQHGLERKQDESRGRSVCRQGAKAPGRQGNRTERRCRAPFGIALRGCHRTGLFALTAAALLTFAACHSLDDWALYQDQSRGLAFKYPPDLGTQYIHALDWPPKAAVHDGPFSCTEAGSITARAGRTERRNIGGRAYCVTREAEGAAGSIYTLYAYAFPREGKTVILTFGLRAVQCGNYDEPKKTECERERRTFAIDPVIDRIARTIRLDIRHEPGS